jgi:hypothetical protein
MSSSPASTSWASPVLAKAYYAVGGLRSELAQPIDSEMDQCLARLLDAIEAADVEMERAA